MHEVEPRPVGDPGRVRVTPSGPRDRVPAGVRYPDVRGEPLDVAGEQGEAGVGILVAPLEEDLHPHAHPEDGPARVDGRPDRGLKSGRAERAHAGAEAADAGDQHALGVPSLRSIGRDTDVCANVREGAGDREEVPHPIVEHRDPCRHSEPFVDGTPPRSVTAHASPSAFASALNSASHTWCGERPRFRWTCTVSSAACARHRQRPPRVLPELLEHVVEESEPGLGSGLGVTIQVERDRDLGLLRGPFHARRPAHPSTSFIARRNRSVSCSLPAVTRSEPGTTVDMSRISTPRSSRPCQTTPWSTGGTNRTKLASDGRTLTPGITASSWPIRSRCRRTESSRASASERWWSATTAAVCCSDDRWYGSRTRSRSPTIDGAVRTYPTRAPAIANALLKVRTTATLSCSSSSGRALVVGENSP